GRWHYITAGALNGLHIERGVLALVGFGVPDGVVLVLELAGKITHDGVRVLFGRHTFGATERVWEGNELGAVTKVAVAAAVTVAGGNARGTQGTAVVTPFKGEHQALA